MGLNFGTMRPKTPIEAYEEKKENEIEEKNKKKLDEEAAFADSTEHDKVSGVDEARKLDQVTDAMDMASGDFGGLIGNVIEDIAQTKMNGKSVFDRPLSKAEQLGLVDVETQSENTQAKDAFSELDEDEQQEAFDSVPEREKSSFPELTPYVKWDSKW